MRYKVSIYQESIEDVAKEEINQSKICSLISEGRYELTIEELADAISRQYVWCPAQFKGSKKCQNELKSIQLFALDFDGDITIKEVVERSKKYCIPIAMVYETMSSVKYSRFRVVFACNQEITYKNMAVLIQYCLCTIFEGVDKSSKDFSKLYYPGKNVKTIEQQFSIYELLLSMMKYIRDTDNKNYSRRMKSLQSKTNIILINNSFLIRNNFVTIDSNAPSPLEEDLELEKLLKSEENRAVTIYNNMVDAPKSSNLNIFFSNEEKALVNVTKKNRKNIRVNIMEKTDCCKLLKDFINGERLSHDEWVGIMSNLIYLKSGKKLFADILTKYVDIYGDIERKIEQMRWWKDNNYHQYRCDSFCPYADKCNHCSNICYTLSESANKIFKLEQDIKYKPISEIRVELAESIHNSLYNTIGINFIKAPTGAGKTYAYLNEVKNSNKQTIVAVPNAKLMNAIASEAESMGITYMLTPVIDDVLRDVDKETAEKIKFNYLIGEEQENNYLLRECSNPTAQEYLKRLDEKHKFKGELIITTHARLLYMDDCYLNSRNVIIDEDILNQMIQICSVSVKEISNLLADLNSGMFVNKDIINKLQSIVNIQNYKFLDETKNLTLTDKSIIKSKLDSSKWSSNIYQALESTCFYRENGEDLVSFLHVNYLPNCNCTILSATADEDIYRGIFGTRLHQFLDLGSLKNQGKLILHHDKTYSRNCIRETPDIIEKIRNKHKECEIITFKEYAKYGEIYLGASQGFNKLQGKDIAVIGSFHRPEFVYKLWSMFIERRISKDVLAKRKVVRNGFSFPIMTYKEGLIQTIQLWMIESESEQAVGRARLVSHNCTVHLYSNFPIKNSILDEEI